MAWRFMVGLSVFFVTGLLYAPTVGDPINGMCVWSGTTGNTTLSVGTNTFLVPNNSNATLLTADTAGVTRVPVPRAVKLQNLYVVFGASPGPGKTNTITVMTNGAASALAVNIVGTATNGNDMTHTVSVSGGTEIGVRVTTASASTAVKAAWSFEGR